MSSARFFGANGEAITAAVTAALAAYPGCVVRVGAEGCGARNVGVDPGLRPVGVSPAVHRHSVAMALEAAGVCLTPNSVAPQVAGRIRGSVWTTEAPAPRTLGCSTPPPAVRSPFRSEAVRDALGLLRLLYLVSDEIPETPNTAELLEHGSALSRALRGQDQAGAVAAIEALAALSWPSPVSSLLQRAARMVRGGEAPRAPTELDLKREARRLRG